MRTFQEVKEDTNIPFLLLCVALGFLVGRNTGKQYYNPRTAVNGIDSIYTKDSIYVVHLKIDEVFAQDVDPEDKPRP